MVANVQHVPANTPPSPPNSIEEPKEIAIAVESDSDVYQSESSTPGFPGYSDATSSEGEGFTTMSPLQKIAQEMDALEDERRDQVGPLSPSSSRGSMSSRSSANSQRRRYRFQKSSSVTSRSSNGSAEGTLFSLGSSIKTGGRESMSIRTGHESISIRSLSSTASSAGHYMPGALRQEVHKRKPETHDSVDLFPFAKARLSEVPFRSPSYSAERSIGELRQQMLSIVFGWEDDVEALIRDER